MLFDKLDMNTITLITGTHLNHMRQTITNIGTGNGDLGIIFLLQGPQQIHRDKGRLLFCIRLTDHLTRNPETTIHIPIHLVEKRKLIGIK